MTGAGQHTIVSRAARPSLHSAPERLQNRSARSPSFMTPRAPHRLVLPRCLPSFSPLTFTVCSMAGFEVRVLPKVRMVGEEFVHKDGVWALQVRSRDAAGWQLPPHDVLRRRSKLHRCAPALPAHFSCSSSPRRSLPVAAERGDQGAHGAGLPPRGRGGGGALREPDAADPHVLGLHDLHQDRQQGERGAVVVRGLRAGVCAAHDFTMVPTAHADVPKRLSMPLRIYLLLERRSDR
jgi:hypothetical protein